MKTTPLILVFVALAGLDVVAALLALQKIGASASLPAVPTAAAVHFLVAAIGAMAVAFFPGASDRSGHRTVAMLAGALCLFTPVVGPLVAALLVRGIYQKSAATIDHEAYVFGNPMRAHRVAVSPTTVPVSEPLALSLGFGHLHGQRLAPSLLRRVGSSEAISLLRRLFQQPDARTQLYAQSALGSLFEKSETSLARQRKRAAQLPDDPWQSANLAKALIQTAKLGIHPVAESESLLREAITWLDYATDLRPKEPEFYFEKAVCLIELGDRPSLDRVPDLYGRLLALPGGQSFSNRLDVHYFAAVGNWARTATTVTGFVESGNIDSLPPACRTFWTCPLPE